ncbi:hypothetical protein HU751_023150 [Pseudomonas sp. BW13M1]|uniref:Restriction alleviation protein Lar n=1 Tax=Pseudomonas peradeniyensis TaxID=2745488 RepID=A0A923G9J1_9PSED|nr:hypothetical protein [Pseudomonas peradeniyensis]MBV4507733.1 hypothetical protein [Pseudomonas peradeniyensis]
MNMPSITECRECGSTSLTWDTHNKNISQAQHGRLTTQDIRCQFVLGCDHCSETLAVVSADQVAAWLTETRETSAEPSAPVERDERADFAKWTHEVIGTHEFEGVHHKVQRRDSMSKDDESMAWGGWQARAALERKPSSGQGSSEPIAWHVGGNGYDRVCFEHPGDITGDPCVQPINDLRQLIGILKRYSLTAE